jgi:hypothetical protein
MVRRHAAFLVALGVLVTAVPVEGAEVDYVRDVKPILRARCYACHGAVRQKAGLRLDAASLIRKGGRHGPVIDPGKADASRLIEAVLGRDRPRMPPESEGEGLPEKDVALLRAWIDQGAKAPDEPVPGDPRDHWAFRPPTRPAVPAVRAGGPAPNPVDAFLAAERAKRGLGTNLPADKTVLLRRVYLDLVGLPPTREELHAFLADDRPDAYERVVERLLASPEYGERWGRHWMDVWRYSDPFGLGEEYRYSQRHVWRWRDWIIESLNADKGYDRMIVEMLAADEIAPADRDALRATGYLARNWYKFNRNVWIQDTVEYTAAGFLGITLRCARCHDHKYDPITQREYYQFRAFFEPHDVRIDPLPGQPDTTKDGVARAFDGKPDAPTYLFRRGDERLADTSRPLSPGVPAVLGGEVTVRAVRFTPADHARALGPAVEEARRLARANVDAAEAGARQAEGAVDAARRRVEQVAAGVKPADPGPEPFLHDTFAAALPDVWRVVSGPWSWESGRLVCKTPSTFATVTTRTNLPPDLMGRVRYRTTGGGIGSVGFSYDVAGNGFQAVYINAGNNSAVRAFHRVNGQDVYPADGVVPHPVGFQEEVTLDFAVRGNLLNTWVNGKLRNVYRLPVARREGAFSLWAHDATAEFLELRLAALPAGVQLAEKAGEDRPSPLGGSVMLTRADAERALHQAEEGAALAGKKAEAARAERDAVEARAGAEQVRYAEPVDEARWRTLALVAGKAERQAAALKAAEALLRAEAAAAQAKAAPAASDTAKKALADAEKKLAAAKKAHADALSAAGRDEPTYTPLVRLDPETSTGRRLALARWITDRNNPLTARVAVNHVWMRHFGRPLVPSVANFGLAGKPPTHPELLDWLAMEFMDSGWSLKHLHRLLVTSEAYRLGSQDADPARRALDPDNRWYWRMNPRRMEAEAVRDSLLAAAGQLDPAMGGPILDEKLGQTSRRRSVYFRFNTEYRMQFLDQFDAPSPSECFERRESVVPQQALALANSALALNQSRLLARRLTAAAPGPGEFVTAAFEQVLGRPPTAEETARCERFLRDQAELLREPGKLTPFPPGPDAAAPPATDPAQHAREDLVQVLFNHNDFVTIR